MGCDLQPLTHVCCCVAAEQAVYRGKLAQHNGQTNNSPSRIILKGAEYLARWTAWRKIPHNDKHSEEAKDVKLNEHLPSITSVQLSQNRVIRLDD